MKNKRVLKIFVSVLIALISLHIQAQTNDFNKQTLLWKISGNGLKADSYIILTTNNTCANLSLRGKFLNTLSKVQSVAFESGLANPDNESKMKKLVIIKDGDNPIKNIISKGLYSQLVAQANKVGINEGTLNTFHPAYITGLSIKLVSPCQISIVKTTEQLLRTYAHDYNVKIYDLTSPEENFDFFNAYPASYWEQTLNQIINHSSDVSNELDNKTDFYSHENLRGVCAVINKSALFKVRYGYPDIENKKMELLKTRIQNLINKQNTLIQLDISDVANPGTSIFSILVKSGYVISPISE